MQSDESSDKQPLRAISTDSDFQNYLEYKYRGRYAEHYPDAGLVYAMMRNFHVEPLSASTASFLMELQLDQGYARVLNPWTIVVLCPFTERVLNCLSSRFKAWGYSVDELSRREYGGSFVPVIEVTAIQTPSPFEQLRVLSTVSPDPEALIDGWMSVVHNRTHPPDDRIPIGEWAGIRGITTADVRENTERLATAIREFGGIPGTQWEVSERGGVSVETPLDEV